MKLMHLISFSAKVLIVTTLSFFTAYSDVQPSPSPAAPSVTTPLPPNLNEVAKLASTGVSDDIILAYIKNSQATYNLSANNVLQLKDAGVSSKVITAMINHNVAAREAAIATSPVTAAKQPVPVPPPAPPAAVTAPETPSTAAPRSPAPVIAGSGPVVTAPLTPPASQVEVVPVAPGPDYDWAPGYWRWDGGWIWMGGRWNVRMGYGWGPHYRGWGGYHHGGYGHRR